MSGKFALIIANTEYIDPGLAQLSAPGKDAEDFARVLQDQAICAFDDVRLVLNEPEHMVRGMIDEFFDQKKPDDLLVLYFSGQGVRDELGALYLAVKNTIRTRLRSTAIKSDYVREAMHQSRSRRRVMILDCCNSGAFTQGTKAATGMSIGTATAFEAGYGRITLTASDSTQFAWEGNQVIGETDNSLFTHFLVRELEGEADLDGDGRITIDELYDYVYEQGKLATPKQTPSKFSSKQQGEIILREHIRIEEIKPVPLLAALLDSIENPFPEVRLGTVHHLTKLLKGRNLGLASSASEALERIAKEDDSRIVSGAASEALATLHQAEGSAMIEEPKRQTEGERLIPLAEQEAHERYEADQEVTQEMEARPEVRSVERNVSQTYQPTEAASVSTTSSWNPVLWVTLAWAIGGAIYWSGGDYGVVIGGFIGWAIGRGVQDADGWPFGVYIGKTTGWALGRAIGGGMSGIVMGWPLMKYQRR